MAVCSILESEVKTSEAIWAKQANRRIGMEVVGVEEEGVVEVEEQQIGRLDSLIAQEEVGEVEQHRTAGFRSV